MSDSVVKEKKYLYKTNDFVVVKDLTAKHDFTLCLIKENVDPSAKEVKVVYLIRDKDRSVRSFFSLKDQKIQAVSILFKAKKVVVTEPEGTRKSKPMDSRKIEISTSEENYNSWKAKVKLKLKDEGKKAFSVEEDLEEEEEEELPEGRIKVVRDSLVAKISKSRGASLRKSFKARVGRTDSDSEKVFESEPEEDDGSGAKVRKDKKVRGAKSVGVKRERKAKVVPTFKRGVYNTQVVMVPQSVQYDSPSTSPNFECCLFCNNKELLRATKLNSSELFANIFSKIENLNQLSFAQGPCSLNFPIIEAIKHENINMVIDILKYEDSIQTFTRKRNQIHFSAVETGYNDKYAYGVATRAVDMARGTREGTNAFLYDNQNFSKSTHNPAVMKLICKYIRSEDVFFKLIAMDTSFENLINSNFYRVVESGNIELAKLISLQFVKYQGFGFNEFHSLALTAQSVDTLAKLMKVNCRKKASGNRQVTPTHLASMNPNPDILKRFLEVGEEMFITDEYQRKPIHYAALSPGTGPLQLLLDKGVDCRDYDRFKWTPLMFAAMANRPENIALMCSKVAYNLNMKNKEGNAAIHIAVENSNLESLKELIKAGADINLPGKYRKTSLIIACEIDCAEIAEFLIGNNAKINSTDKYGKTALIHAATSGNIRTVTYLLSKGIDYRKNDSSGNSALHFACSYGHYELIEQLVKAGCSVNSVNNWNLSPILVALMKNHPRCLKLLVNYPEIDVNCQDKNGLSLIDSCANQFTDMSFEFCEFLIKEKHANVNVEDFSGNSVFHRLAMRVIQKETDSESLKEAFEEFQAKRTRFSKFFNLFCQAGIDKNRRNLKGYTPVEIAVNESNWLFLETALQYPDFDFATPNKKGKFVLHYLHKIFFSPKHLPLLFTILSKFDKSLDIGNQFDKKGMNFYHSLLFQFLSNLKSNPFQNWHDQKAVYYQSYLKKAQESGNSAELKMLDEKIGKLRFKISRKESQAISSFISFNGFLDDLGFNFFNKVAIRTTPVKEFLEKKAKKNIQKKAPTKNRFRYAQKVEEGQNQSENDYKNEDLLAAVVNEFAGYTVLHLGMQFPVTRIIENLIGLGLKHRVYFPNEKTYFGETVFHKLIEWGSKTEGIIRMLASIGEDPNIPDTDGNLPFYSFCTRFGSSQAGDEQIASITEFASVPSLDINQPNRDKETPFLLFSKQRNLRICQLLLNHGANPHLSDKNNRNALHWAINNNTNVDTNFEFEEFLISLKVDLNQLDIRSRGPIHYFFVKVGYPFINSRYEPIDLFADFLLNKNVHIDLPDVFGNTPLCYAAQRGAALSFGILVKRNANINRLNKLRNSPMAIALIHSHHEIAAFCIQKNCEINIVATEISSEALTFWNTMVDSYKVAKEKEQLHTGLPPTINRAKVDQFIQERLSNLKTIRAFEKVDDRQVNLTKVKAKNVSELTAHELREWEKNDFIKTVKNVFKLSLDKKFDSINYLLLDFGSNLGSAIADSLESKMINYSIKMLKKRPDENNPKFNDQFKFKNEFGQNIAHYFAKNSLHFDESNSLILIDLMIQKGIDISAADCRKVTPLMYLAFNCSNMKVISYFISKVANSNSLDDSNNWFLSLLVQNKSFSMLFKQKNVSKTIRVKSKGFGKGRSKKTRYAIPAKKKPVELYNNFSGNVMVAPNGFNISGFQSFEFPNSFANAPQTNLNSSQSYLQNSMKASQPSLIGSNPDPDISSDNILSNLTKDPEQQLLSFIEENIKLNNQFVNSVFELFEPDKTTKSPTKKGFTLLSFALRKLKSLQLSRLIIENGGNINWQNPKGHTIMTWAIRHNRMPLIDFLMDFRSKINFDLVDVDGNTYIHHIVSPMKCASFENTKLLDYFVTKKNLDQPNSEKKPPIFYAMTQESGIMSEKLLSMGAKKWTDNKVQKKTPILSNKDFLTNLFDFEEDFKLAVVRGQEMLKGEEVDVVEVPKPNQLIQGDVELCQDAECDFYDVKLIKVDIKYGYYSENVFYTMQICFDRVRRIFILFTNWGRIGTTGQYQQTPFFSLEDCLKEFNKVFKEKTGNDYEARKNFIKKHKKYRLISIKHRVHKNLLVNLFDPLLDKTVPSKLNWHLQSLMDKLTNSKMIQMAYSRGVNIDTDLMPFGTLTNDSIQTAKALLLDIQAMAKNLETNRKTINPKDAFEIANEIAEKTSEFFEIIPTVGNRTGPMQALTVATCENQVLRLNNLEYLEIISRILSAAVYRMSQIHPYDYCIRSLGIKIDRLPIDSEEYFLVDKYMNSERKNKTAYKLVNVYAIERMGEEERIKKWMSHKNNRLLWHGTRVENCMGILHQGLRVSPFDSSRTGARLWNGIYFTDRFSYCAAFGRSGLGWSKSSFVFLCEVALGNMQKVYQAQQLKPMTPTTHSIKGIGKFRPVKSQRVYLGNGTQVPCGKPFQKYDAPPAKDITWFEFEQNEFVVGNKEQVKLKYLVEFIPLGYEGFSDSFNASQEKISDDGSLDSEESNNEDADEED
jgi:ankyrin repeat protein/predicted DNA-binding WGR domain protein